MTMGIKHWEFWVDVGGTFTDVLARTPDGVLLSHKLLSTGVTKGSVAEGSSRQVIVDPARVCDPEDFWKGYQVRFIGEEGSQGAIREVASFDATRGALRLSAPLDDDPKLTRRELQKMGKDSLMTLADSMGVDPGQSKNKLVEAIFAAK